MIRVQNGANRTRDDPGTLASGVQGVCAQLGAQKLSQGPTDQSSREHIEDRAQIEPALVGGDVSQVGEPQLVGLLGGEVPFDQIGGGNDGWIPPVVLSLAPEIPAMPTGT